MIKAIYLPVFIHKPSQSFKFHKASLEDAVKSEDDYVFQSSSFMRYSDKLLLLA